MIYDVQYMCGHEGKLEIFGSERGRVEWIKQNKICPDCANPKPPEPEPEPAIEELPVPEKAKKERKKED